MCVYCYLCLGEGPDGAVYNSIGVVYYYLGITESALMSTSIEYLEKCKVICQAHGFSGLLLVLLQLFFATDKVKTNVFEPLES